jgi:acetolactate synthase I/II/III large subunit
MTVERMLTTEEPASELVGRVLQEAGIEYVFGISGGHTGRIVSGLRKYQNSVRMVLVREESLAGVMAEVYGRLTRRPGVMIGQGPWVLGNGLIGTIEAFLSSSPMLLLTDFSDATRFHLHAPYQQATGDYGSWDARRAFSGVTKQVMQAHEPIAAVQATQLAIKHALAGQPGPVAVLFDQDSLAGMVSPGSQPGLYHTRHYLPAPARRCGARRGRRTGAARRPAAGADRRQRRAHRPGL